MKSPSPTIELHQSIQRSREYYGFVLYLASWIFFFLYIVWSTFPEEWLHSLGIYYYPNHKWALIFPIWNCGFLIFILLFYIGHNLYSILPISSIHTFTDNNAYVLAQDDFAMITNMSDQEYIPPLQDLPLFYVSLKASSDNTILEEE